jgi:integrase
MKRKNGDGTVVKMTGNRRKPYAVRKVIGWKEDGRPILKYISYHKTKREAENALNKYNEDPYTLNRMTLDDLYKEWFEIQEREKAETTLRQYSIRYKHLGPIHDEKIKDIDAIMLENLYATLDITGGMLSNVQTLVGLLLKYAVKRRYLPVSALNIIKAINTPVKRESRKIPHKLIDKKDIDMLWQIKDHNEYAKIILVYIYTGLRYSELKNLDLTDCHDNYIEIKKAKTAAGVRIVPICDKLKDVLPIMQVPPHTTFDRYFKMLLPDHAIHDTRHTFISMLTEKGVDVRIIKAIVGHSINDVTAIYTHITLDMMLEAVNKL